MSDKKLELKHLAPYLPYGMKMSIDLKCSNTLYLTSSNIDEADRMKYVPILRSLSDLTKDTRYSTAICPLIKLGGLSYTGMMNRIQEDPLYYSNWHVLEYLFKNYFDVFGLIESGLAININEVVQ